jgi:hypothetical protein
LKLLEKGCVSFLATDAENERGKMVVAVRIDAILGQDFVVGFEEGSSGEGFRGGGVGDVILREGDNVV